MNGKIWDGIAEDWFLAKNNIGARFFNCLVDQVIRCTIKYECWTCLIRSNEDRLRKWPFLDKIQSISALLFQDAIHLRVIIDDNLILHVSFWWWKLELDQGDFCFFHTFSCALNFSWDGVYVFKKGVDMVFHLPRADWSRQRPSTSSVSSNVPPTFEITLEEGWQKIEN